MACNNVGLAYNNFKHMGNDSNVSIIVDKSTGPRLRNAVIEKNGNKEEVDDLVKALSEPDVDPYPDGFVEFTMEPSQARLMMESFTEYMQDELKEGGSEPKQLYREIIKNLEMQLSVQGVMIR